MNKCDRTQHIINDYIRYSAWILSENEISVQIRNHLSDTIQVDKTEQLCDQINYFLPRELL